jgi:hypothetical protein
MQGATNSADMPGALMKCRAYVRVFEFLQKILAVHAVNREQLSALNSLLCRENTGNFVALGLFPQISAGKLSVDRGI